jgi:uncharacterized protein
LYTYDGLVGPKYASELTRLAIVGDDPSAFRLGQLYEIGYGVSANTRSALQWYRNAAALKNYGADLRLGRLYEDGVDVPQDLTEALDWYDIAARSGAPEAASRASVLRSRLKTSRYR